MVPTRPFDPARLHDPGFATDPHPVWRRLRDAHPIVHDTVDDAYVVTRHADVRGALFDTERLSNRLYRKTLWRVFGPNLIQQDGAEHLARRRLVAPLLIGDRLAGYAPLVEEVAREVVEPFRARGVCGLRRPAGRAPST